MSITVIPSSTYNYFKNNKAAIRTVFENKGTEALDHEVCCLKMYKYTNSIELDKRAENLSNLMAALFIQKHDRKAELEAKLSELKKKNDDKLDTPFFTQIINIELNNIKNDFLSRFFPGTPIRIDDFKPKDLSTNPRMTYTQFYDKLKSVYDLVIKKAANHVGCDIVDPDFKLQYTDLKTKMPRTLPSADTINCIRYAFYQAREKRLEHWIFEETSLNPFASKGPNSNPKELPGYVIVQKMTQDLGYRLVNQAQPNDIIFYIDKNDQFTHCGVMHDANTVYSLQGSMSQVIAHPTNSVPKCFKNRYLLFRPERSEWILDSARFQAKQ